MREEKAINYGHLSDDRWRMHSARTKSFFGTAASYMVPTIYVVTQTEVLLCCVGL